MPDHLESYREKGWAVFEHDNAIAAWAAACAPLAGPLSCDPQHSRWMRCDGTWFAGVNALPNAGDGSVAVAGVPPLEGAAVAFVRDTLGHGGFEWDCGQVSIVWPGYPRHGSEDTEASYRYRVRRCAAHVDGLERSPDRRRKLSETHGFLIGIPLGEADVEQGAFVVWRGSHEIMRRAFRKAFAGTPPERWREVDLTEAYTAARSECFETCEAVEIAPGLGCAYVMHPLALHGIAPRRAEQGSPRAVAYFRPDTFGGDPAKWLAA